MSASRSPPVIILPRMVVRFIVGFSKCNSARITLSSRSYAETSL